jgi:hypothetical protein
VVGAGTATAGSIDLTVITPGHVPSESIYCPGDLVTVEVSLDSAGLGVNAYFFHIQSEGLSIAGVEPGSQWIPYFSTPYPEYWAHLSVREIITPVN